MNPLSLDDIFESSGAEPDKYTQFMQLVSEIVTGVTPVTSLESRLATDLGLTKTAPVIATQLLSFIGYSASIPPTAPQPLHQEIAETEAALAQTIPVRTMARDMHDLESQAPAEAPVYRSEQPNVRNRPLTDIPRWDSERT